ncbi:non-ribosomal peptide synthetase [Streptomyces europaeiscabiei]|uniref:non-ribosomal peptide synthetase n=1 Tax=Streptomyces europaeiscabiei TaxID=146819 RepID=UPI0029AC95A6|nr:amino acid adenylation domain-containing protein [Streptomyces europaeiscabiei]MDX3584054.1 amino acid adenylation domain-containing protein [Streptomyces europaeiscabiei]MDX3628919.1 amino acid adenylation domain-containing protein [Streptomyces europaeiscabiei]MDX3647463.1 amino acid adenylation domain-containing protein [Streptomyces europaeiscabiei]
MDLSESGDAARKYWHEVLTAGGRTVVPRWSADPAKGVAAYEVALPERLLTASDGTAALLAAHAKVLAALSGEGEVTTGWLEDGRTLPCRLTTAPGDTWRALLGHTHRVTTELLTHAGYPVDALRHELGLSEPPFETVLDTSGGDGDLDEDVVLRVGLVHRDDGPALRLRYRTDVLDEDGAARIAGYHVTALTLLAAEPDAEHGRRSLVSDDELRFQLDGLAGPHRELPDRRVHELFEQRVVAHPDAVAAVHGDRRWTYRELNSRANQLSRALLVRGLGHEGVVAVVTERNLDWMAAVLAVFKAGGAYLPVEPHFPAERVATTLARAGCELVLTERGSTAALDRALSALPGVQRLLVEDAYDEAHPDSDLGMEITPDRLAYIYFTSGSTGEPKGAMCEHAGMLNHLHAKLDDLGIGEGDVVAQTAPQCFDISLWQLLAGPLAGGRTLLVEQEVILDVGRFVDRIADGRANVVQVVPSYLEAVLAHLEQHPRELPALRRVSVTGEALKQELAERWFASEPGIPLVNAYGLTETSDDTNHEVMDRAPEGGRVPLGRPVRNVRVYVVDEHLSLVPLGAPGEIVFSGVCVGRGYVNDPERTARAFTTDPYRPGERLYRSGDHGRWRPDGKLEFLGRRDTQVKVRGFRIEIGEVENALLKVAGVRDGAVVVARGARLVAFHSGRPLAAEELRGRLADSLPAYMVPSVFHWRESLPLTGNGKIDRRTLTALAEELDAMEGTSGEPPATPTEERLAAAWAEVLGVPRAGIGRRDHFFDRGGTSLSAVKLAIALERAVSPKDVTGHPVLSELAGLIDTRAVAHTAGTVGRPS